MVHQPRHRQPVGDRQALRRGDDLLPHRRQRLDSIYNAASKPVISADGSTPVSFYSVDVAGNDEAVHSITVNLDQTPPEVSMTGPAANWYTNNNQPTLTASASDANSGVASVQFQIFDGTSWTNVGSPVTSAPYAVQTGVLADGSYQVRAVAADAAGNGTTSAAVSFTVDTRCRPSRTSPTCPIRSRPTATASRTPRRSATRCPRLQRDGVTLSDAGGPGSHAAQRRRAGRAAQSVVWDGQTTVGRSSPTARTPTASAPPTPPAIRPTPSRWRTPTTR